MNYNGKEFRQAHMKGYMNGYEQKDWRTTFVGAFLTKYPNRTGVLDILKIVVGHTPKWEDMTDQNLRDFKEEVASRMSPNATRTTMYRIKSILNEYKGEVEIPSLKYDSILVAKKEPTINVFLTEDEVERLGDCITKDPNEDYVKCAIMISCYTGCRHSDAMKATEENIQNGYFSYVPEKTKNVVVSLPAHRNLRQYLGRYKDFELSDMAFNNIMRKLCKRVGINSRVKVYKGGKEYVGEKWEFVSSHTCRRSFATNLMLRNCEIYTISKLMGHTNTQQTEQYLCTQPVVSDEAMSFFK